MKEAFKEVDEAMDGIDILISNAGISIRNKFIDITPEQWKKVIGINLDGIFTQHKKQLNEC